MKTISKILVVSDIIIYAGFGLIAPIFALFLEDKISGANVATVGMASAIYLISKSLFQIVVAKFNDRERGNKREIYTIFCGSIVFSLVPILFLFATDIYQIYLIQFLHGISVAVAYPGWFTLFTRYINKNQEGYEWSIHDIGISIGVGITSALGGVVAEMFGFETLFIIISLVSFAGTLLLLKLFQEKYFNNHKNEI